MNSVAIAALAVIALIIVAAAAKASQPDKTEALDSDLPPVTTHPHGGFDAAMVGEFSRYTGEFSWDVVGESHYQDALDRTCGGRTEEGHKKIVHALVVPETGNPHDAWAVAIHLDEGMVGHLSRGDARRYRLAIARMGFSGVAFKVPARIAGGWKRSETDQGNYGVKLDIPGSPETAR